MHGWSGIGRFFTALTATGVTGLLLAVAVAVLLAGAFATIGRLTV